MITVHLLALTDRQEDLDLCQAVCTANGLTLHHDGAGAKLTTFFKEHPDTVLFWDVDHPKAHIPTAPTSVQALSQRLLRVKPHFDRIFVASDKPLLELEHSTHLPVFGHHVIRKYDEPFPSIISRVVKAATLPDPFGIAKFAAPDTPVRKIVLTETRHRSATVEALQNLYAKKGLPAAIVSNIAQSIDELLMNAIFDAPVDAHGFTYRKSMDRASNLKLKGRESITLELAESPDHIVISVSDQFGSLEKEAVMGFIRKDYEHENYRSKANAVSSGLGVYGLAQSGQSLLFMSKPGERTEVMLFVPFTKSMKAYRNSFRFFGFIMR